MTYTVINGLEDNAEYAGISDKIRTILNKTGIFEPKSTNWFDLQKYNIKYCMGCDYCEEINPGVCAIKDDEREILKSFITSETVLMITSIHFGCCNAVTKNFMDRSEPFYLPYQIANGELSMMKARYEKYPNLVVLGINDSGADNEKCFVDFIHNSNLYQVCSKKTVKVFSAKLLSEEALAGFIKEEFIYE